MFSKSGTVRFDYNYFSHHCLPIHLLCKWRFHCFQKVEAEQKVKDPSDYFSSSKQVCVANCTIRLKLLPWTDLCRSKWRWKRCVLHFQCCKKQLHNKRFSYRAFCKKMNTCCYLRQRASRLHALGQARPKRMSAAMVESLPLRSKAGKLTQLKGEQFRKGTMQRSSIAECLLHLSKKVNKWQNSCLSILFFMLVWKFVSREWKT